MEECRIALRVSKINLEKLLVDCGVPLVSLSSSIKDIQEVSFDIIMINQNLFLS